MMQYTRWIFVLISVLSLAAPIGLINAQTSGAGTDVPADVRPMIELINRHRSAGGLAPVVEHPVLTTCADGYSQTLAAQGRVSHTGPDGSNPGQRLTRCGYEWRHYGENLAAGQHDAAEAVAAWMDSPPHRRIIMNPRLREVGVGYTYRENDPALYVEYYVLKFGVR